MTLISGDPPILHSYLVESCCFTSLEESNFLINLGGSGKPKRGDYALNCTDSLNKQGNMDRNVKLWGLKQIFQFCNCNEIFLDYFKLV